MIHSSSSQGQHLPSFICPFRCVCVCVYARPPSNVALLTKHKTSRVHSPSTGMSKNEHFWMKWSGTLHLNPNVFLPFSFPCLDRAEDGDFREKSKLVFRFSHPHHFAGVFTLHSRPSPVLRQRQRLKYSSVSPNPPVTYQISVNAASPAASSTSVTFYHHRVLIKPPADISAFSISIRQP